MLPIGPGQSRPLSLFLVSVAASGERKSACDAEAMWPIRRRETALREAHDAEGLHYANDRAAYDRAREAALKTSKGDRAAIRAALDALGPAPLPPLIPMLTCPEPTYEGMCRLLAAGQPSIGIFAAEGGQFVGGHGMSDEARLRTAAGLSALWDGEPIRRVHAGDGITILPGRRVSLHLMAQPTVADLWLRDTLLIDQGCCREHRSRHLTLRWVAGCRVTRRRRRCPRWRAMAPGCCRLWRRCCRWHASGRTS
jgi:hypothetical protein